MKVEYIQNPTPVIVIDDFLSEEQATNVLGECIALRPVYRDAEVLDLKAGSRIDVKSRQNKVVYMDNVFKGNEKASHVLQDLVKAGIFSAEARKIWEAGNTGFEIINRVTRVETVLSRYGNNDFYGFHRDWNFTLANRLITAVYYCNLGAENFKGGRLLLKGDPEVGIEPKHNRLVVFNSGAYHSVEKTEIQDDKFENGRFSVNIWMGFQS